MIVIKIWGVPTDTDEVKLGQILQACRKTVADIGVMNHESAAIFFPTDLYDQGLGEEIVATVELPTNQGNSDSNLGELQGRITSCLADHFPDSKIQVRSTPVPELRVSYHHPQSHPATIGG